MSAKSYFTGLFLIVIPVLCSGYHFNIDDPYPLSDYKDPDIRKADSLLSIRQNINALELYEKTAEKLVNSRKINEYVHALNRIGYLHTVMQGYDRNFAKLRLDEALNLSLKYSTIDSIVLSENYYCQGIYFERKREIELSLEYHNLALSIRLNHPARPLDIAESYFGLGELYRYEIGDLIVAENYYIQCRNILENVLDPNDHRLHLIYFNLYSLYRLKYYFHDADMYARRCIELSENSLLKYSDRVANSYIALANNYNTLEEYSAAKPYYKHAINYLIDLYGEQNPGLGLMYKNLGMVYLSEDSLNIAYEYYDRSLQIYKLYFRDQPNSIVFAQHHFLLGRYYLKTGDYKRALFYYNEGLKIYREIYDNELEWEAIIFEDLWELYYSLQEYDTALILIQKSLVNYIPEFDNQNIYSNPDNIDIGRVNPRIYDVIYKKARTFRNRYGHSSNNIEDLKSALELYQRANELSDKIRNSRMGESSVLFLNDYFRHDYELGLDCAYQLYNLTGDSNYLNDAFEFMERGKYMLLLESIRKAEKLTESDIPEDLRKRKLDVEAEIANTNRLKDQELDKENPDTVQVNKWNQEQLILSREEEDIRMEFEVNYPGYAKIDYDNILIDLKEARDLLSSNSTVVEYFYGDSAIYVLGMSTDDITFQKIDITSEFDSMIRRLLGSFSFKPDSLFKVSYNNYLESSSYLHNAILKPVIDGLDMEKGDNNELLIIPDGLLSVVPFDALISSKPTYKSADYKGLDFLINSYDIHYAYSMNFLNRSKLNGSRGTNIDLLAFSYSANEFSREVNGRSSGIHLPGTDVELDRISSSLKKERSFFRGPDATETRFKELTQSNNLIHLAIHGIADEENYLNSKLLFRVENDSLNDGFLYAPELYNMDLNHVKLAVLSACESGIGKNFKGEGTYSMARGFAYAGVPAIVMSLWNVDDMMTADLMGSFYENLAKGKHIHQALREAKLTFIENTDEYGAHPANWAAFVPMGNMEVVIKEKTNPLIYVGLVFIILSLSILIFQRSKSGRV